MRVVAPDLSRNKKVAISILTEKIIPTSVGFVKDR